MPTVADLSAFTGRYESHEIGSVFQIAVGDDGIDVSLGHAPDRRYHLKQ